MRFALLILLTPLFAFGQCLDDYRVNQRWAPHHLAAAQLATANQLAQSGQPGPGWHFLAQLGDPYAALAANVVDPAPNTAGVYFHQYVYQHWVNVVGPEKTAANFEIFARQHFRQYVEVLNSGTWPDGDQILNSYLTAARGHGLPEMVVFDAVWTASDLSKVVSWQVLNQLPPARLIWSSRICLSITRDAANRSLERDLGLGR